MAEKFHIPIESRPAHEEIHEHVNPHEHHEKVAKGEYHADAKHAAEQSMKSRFRLDWLYTKIRIGNFYPFPLVAILLLGIPVIFMILLAIGVNLGFNMTELPVLKPVLNYMGIYSDGDLFVTSTWVYWWPAFIVAIFFFKRIWCGGFCPFGLMTDIGNFFGKKLRKGELPKPVNIVKYIFIGFLIFKALGYLHDAIGITNSIVLSIEFVVFFLVFSFIIGLIAPRRTFCRVFCFLGSLPHLFGRLSIYTLETDRSKCAKCEGQWCQTGYTAKPEGIATPREPLINLNGCPMYINIPQLSHKESNRNCILCGNCIKNCPYDAIHYKPKVPGYELYKGIDLNIHETIYVLGFIPLLYMFIGMESGALGAFGQMLRFPINSHALLTAAYYGLALLVSFFSYYLLSGLGALILNVKHKLALRNFGYIFLPFLYAAMVRDIVITYFLKGSFLPVEFPDIVVLYPFLDIPLILIGAAWSIYMAKRISEVTLQQGEVEDAGQNRVLTNTLLFSLPVLWLTHHWITSMVPGYKALLAFYDIHISVPFFVGAGLIGGFIIAAKYWIGAKSASAKKPVGAEEECDD